MSDLQHLFDNNVRWAEAITHGRCKYLNVTVNGLEQVPLQYRLRPLAAV